MDLSNYQITYVFLNIVDTYTLHKFIQAFFGLENKYNVKILYLIYICFFILTSITFLLFPYPLLLLDIHFIFFIIVSYYYNRDMKNSILYSVIYYVIIASLESIVYLFSNSQFKSFLDINTYNSISGLIIIRILSFIAALGIGNLQHIKNGRNIPKIYWISIFIVPLAVLFVIMNMLQVNNLPYLRVSILLLFLVVLACFFLYDATISSCEVKLEKSLLLQQNKYYENQFKSMETSVQNMKALRHDLKNHLYTLKSLIEQGKNDKAIDYITKINNKSEIGKDYIQTGNIVIDSIINFKKYEASVDGIIINTTLIIPETMDFTAFDLVAILGNMLDNAINAVKFLKQEDKTIDIILKYDRGRLFIKTKNKYKKTIQKANKTKRKLLTNLEMKYGLSNINSALEQYNGIMKIEENDDFYVLIILMYEKI